MGRSRARGLFILACLLACARPAFAGADIAGLISGCATEIENFLSHPVLAIIEFSTAAVNRLLEIPIDPHQAALVEMDVFYQNCAASKLPLYDTWKDGEMRGYEMVPHAFNGGRIAEIADLSTAQSSQRYMNCPAKNLPSQCQNLCQTPPTYLFGGKGVYVTANSLDLEANPPDISAVVHHPGIDCSGFVNTAFALAGLKVDPALSPVQALNTYGAKRFMHANACFNQVEPALGDFLRDGDVIAWKTHVVMVDSVGKDPFGLNEIHSVKDCVDKEIDPDKFELTIINSRGGIDPLTPAESALQSGNPKVESFLDRSNPKLTGVGVGISRMNFSDFLLSDPVQVIELAKSACYAKFGQTLPLENVGVVRQKLVGTPGPYPKNDPCWLRPSERITLKGSECLSSCS